NERLGVLVGEVPLRVTAEARVIVEYAEQQGPAQLTTGQRDGALGLVEVEVPEAVDVSDLVRTALASHEARLDLVPARLSALRRWRSRRCGHCPTRPACTLG